jgi:hypothetical protein
LLDPQIELGLSHLVLPPRHFAALERGLKRRFFVVCLVVEVW